MIVIRYKTLVAAFDGTKWTGEDDTFVESLNGSWDDVELTASVPYRRGPRGTGGLDGLALEAAIGFLGDEVEVAAYQAMEPPLEEAGVED